MSVKVQAKITSGMPLMATRIVSQQCYISCSLKGLESLTFQQFRHLMAYGKDSSELLSSHP